MGGSLGTLTKENILFIFQKISTTYTMSYGFKDQILNRVSQDIVNGRRIGFGWSKDKGGLGKHYAVVLTIDGVPVWTFDYGTDENSSFALKSSNLRRTFYINK